MRIMTVVGARPQFVKAAPVSRVLRGRHEEIIVHTGQHYDDEMSEAFFRELELPEPEVNLEVGGGGHAEMTAEMIRKLEPVILGCEPEAILVYGDTNSTLAAAVVGSKITYPAGRGRRRPWMAHVEAGLRSFNRAMPEERNRVVVDHLAELLLAPTQTAAVNLEREGLGARTRMVGDVMVDGLRWAASRAPSTALNGIAPAGGYILLTLHRPDNVDDPAQLGCWIDALRGDEPVVFPIHPRTRAALVRAGIDVPANVILLDPVGYLTMLALEAGARAVATDSGGVQKEAYLLGVPCITLRAETEWIETVEAGWNRVVGRSTAALRAALGDEEFLGRDRARPPFLGDGEAAGRIVAELEAYPA